LGVLFRFVKNIDPTSHKIIVKYLIYLTPLVHDIDVKFCLHAFPIHLQLHIEKREMSNSKPCYEIQFINQKITWRTFNFHSWDFSCSINRGGFGFLRAHECSFSSSLVLPRWFHKKTPGSWCNLPFVSLGSDITF
jgi:hypothetical protein